MLVSELAGLIGGNIICGHEMANECQIQYGFSSDLMSDVLTLDSDKLLLITGLTNTQAIRTAEMSDIPAIVFVRNKKVTNEMIELAKELSIILIECKHSMFHVSGQLFNSGLKAMKTVVGIAYIGNF